MAKKKARAEANPITRQCANVKSRKHPDIQCSLAATDGEFCGRHAKHPVRYTKPVQVAEDPYAQLATAKKIQIWWRMWAPIRRFKHQGPATNATALAENQTDIYTLDPVDTIPTLYRWSYVDANHHIWLFDLRSLSMAHAQENQEANLKNPYTREVFSPQTQDHFNQRCAWLRARKYFIMHTGTVDLTEEQIWHQRVLDTALKYDMLGYHMCIHWFEELGIQHLVYLYVELWELWYFRLQLQPQIKQQVVPQYDNPDTLLFKWHPHEFQRNTKRWFQISVLDVLDRLVSSAALKEHKILGALYGMTAFAIVSPTVRQHYPWLVEM
jgi:hypothetical protein